MINVLKECASKVMFGIYSCIGVIGWCYFFIIAGQYKYESQIVVSSITAFFAMSFIFTTMTCIEDRKSTTFLKFINRFLFVVPVKMLILLGVLFTFIYFKTEGTLVHEIGLWITLVIPATLFLVTWVLKEIHDYKQENIITS
ncbi:hypothetical protein P5815_30595 [Bacillus cereus]|uniref:hypothetical protein n=1 Tax=Bacillus cereus TaxID=1396 RepID=UPI0024066277|nr:hypothetical protein [Bacillus cereus]MCU5064890.1 hypothetical protein [Bacillus cereus]MDF9524850.1 hypothetical protein [Bacillus cereus]MDF9564529.1 hypothetical protein [Bacillus cereus]